MKNFKLASRERADEQGTEVRQETPEARESRGLTRTFFDLNGKIGEERKGRKNRARRDKVALALEKEAQREDETKRFVTWIAWASFAYRCHPYTWHTPPTRPLDLPGDHAIYATLQKSKRKVQAGRKPTNQEFEVVSIFGAWLAEVLRVENENQGNAETVLRAIGIIEEVDGFDERATVLRAWLSKVSGWELPDVVEWRSREWLTMVSFNLARNIETMPTWLREGSRPTSFDPAAYVDDEDS